MNPAPHCKITVTTNGPYLVDGKVPIANQHIVPNDDGDSVEWREGKSYPEKEKCALCRCGHSNSKPFCDGSHKRVGFDGTETASRAPYAEQAQEFMGPTMILDDAESLCTGARFCDAHGTAWKLVEQSDKRATQLVEQEAGHCPGGRLVARNRASGKELEPKLAPSIGLVQDTAEKVSGPIWVRGGITVVGADGVPYEVRNRVTLCRCGASSNKPFCDGTHAAVGFTDGTLENE
jgi:CDGSH-type Zn-finger protein